MGKTGLNVMPPLRPKFSDAQGVAPFEIVERRNQHGRTWSQQEDYLERVLSGLGPEARAIEIDYQRKLFDRYSTPVPSAVKRRQRFDDLINSTRPSLRHWLYQSLLKNWI